MKMLSTTGGKISTLSLYPKPTNLKTNKQNGSPSQDLLMKSQRGFF